MIFSNAHCARFLRLPMAGADIRPIAPDLRRIGGDVYIMRVLPSARDPRVQFCASIAMAALTNRKIVGNEDRSSSAAVRRRA
jgi:hypothetical protein